MLHRSGAARQLIRELLKCADTSAVIRMARIRGPVICAFGHFVSNYSMVDDDSLSPVSCFFVRSRLKEVVWKLLLLTKATEYAGGVDCSFSACLDSLFIFCCYWISWFEIGTYS